MANTFYKVSQSTDRVKFIDSLFQSYERQYCESVNSSMNEDLYSLISGIQKSRIKPNQANLQKLLQYYLLNQIMESNSAQSFNKINLIRTANPDIKKDIKGNYYRISEEDTIKDNTILEVNRDGSYIVQEVRKDYQYKIIKLYNLKHELTDIRIKDANGFLIQDKQRAADILNLHKEYQTKHRYSGISGNSNDLLNKILNKFSKPQGTGYYLDLYCSSWKWNFKTYSFTRVLSRDLINKQPLMVDIEFQNNGTVLRQEYAGVGV